MGTTRKTAAAPTLRAVTYTRISRDDERRGEGVKRQAEDLQRMADSRGARVVARLEDNDLSGSDKVTRPNFNRLVALIEHGDVDMVLVTDLDRLSRGFRSYIAFYEACQAAKVKVMWKGGEADFGTGTGLLTLDNRLAFAREELRVMTGRITRQKQQRREQGLPPGGVVPFGWRTKTATDPSQSKILLDAMDRVLRGESLASIARLWNARKVRGRAGWDANIIGKIVTRPHHAGLLVHNGAVLDTPTTWKPLISRAKYEALRVAVDGRAAVGAHASKRTSTLTGLLLCGGTYRDGHEKAGQPCGHVLYRSSTGHNDGDAVVWRCHVGAARGEGCGTVTVREKNILPYIEEATFRLVDATNLGDLLKQAGEQSDQVRIGKELADLDSREAAMGAAFAAGRIKLTALESFTRTAEQTRRTLHAQLDRTMKSNTLAPFAGKTDALRKAWPTLTAEAKRQIIAEALGTVTVLRVGQQGPKFSAKRLVLGRSRTRASRRRAA